MRVSGFVLDSDEAFGKVKDWSADGLIDRVYLQVEHWPHAEKNKAAFALWKTILNPRGVAVYATLWADSVPALPKRIVELRTELTPDGWLLNIESPPKENEGANLQKVLDAFRPEPVVASYNVPAERIGLDFRHMDAYNAEIHGQCYDGDGNLTVTPAQHLTSAFMPKVFWDGGGGSAWWYRVQRGSSWSWRQARSVQGDSVSMVASGRPTLWADCLRVNGHMEFASSRIVRDAAGVMVGKVFGSAPYYDIGYTIATTRPIASEKIIELAQDAKAAGKPLCKRADLYTFENTTDEQLRALAAAA